MLPNVGSIVWFVKVVSWLSIGCNLAKLQPIEVGFVKIVHGFLVFVTFIVKFDTWISLCWNMNMSEFIGVVSLSWICQSCQVDLLTWFHVCIVLCQTKPSWSLTEISKFVEISALNYSCLGSVVPGAMFLTGPCSVPKWEKANLSTRGYFWWRILWNSSSNWLLWIFWFRFWIGWGLVTFALLCF